MPYFVHCWATGHYAGAYRFETKESAAADLKQRVELFDILGMRYRLTESEAEPCPFCNGLAESSASRITCFWPKHSAYTGPKGFRPYL